MNSKVRIRALAAMLVFGSLSHAQSVTEKSNMPPLAVVPFREMGGHIYVKGVSGSRDLSIVLDTGAPQSLLTQTMYLQLKLPFTGMVTLPPGFGGRVTNPMATTSVPLISLGALAVKNLPFIVIPSDFIPTMPGVETDAIIGSDLFNRYVVELDYSTKVLRLYDPSTYREPQTGCKLALRFGPTPSRLPLVHARIAAEAGSGADAVLFLDTGAQVPMLTNVFTMEHPELLRNVPPGTEQADGIGGGVTRFRVGRLPAIQLGACTVRDPLVIFSQDDAGMGLGGDFYSGEVGLSIFHRFTTIFDYPGRFVVFQSETASGSVGAH